MSARPLVLVGCAALAACAAGCSSTRSKASKFADQGSTAFAAKGLRVSKQSEQVQIVSRDVLRDANGTAAVLGLRNTSTRVLRDVPVAVVVTDRGGAPVYKNDTAGLERGLVSAPVLQPGRTFMWVDDQVQPTGEGVPARVTAKVGAAKPAGKVSLLDPGVPKLEGDPTSGVAAVGRLRNTSDVEQKGVIVSAVARKRGRIVAAGRAIVPRLPAGKSARYSVFFIGDPRGARLGVVAPPTVLETP